MPSSKKVKLVSHGSTSEPVKKTTKRIVKNNDVQGRDMSLDPIGIDNDPGIDVPLHARGGAWKWNFEKKTPLVDKILWVLAVVEVVVLISLVIKNV